MHVYGFMHAWTYVHMTADLLEYLPQLAQVPISG